MRRKSERNKAKGSPEKKVEKPTRKSTRRRGKRSPTVSPEPETVEQSAESTQFVKDTDKESTIITRFQSKEQGKLPEVIEEKVSSTEKLTQSESPEDEDDIGESVWKVARADASPGEIQKLTLCRQRNMSETSSDASGSRKKANKWQDSGEGVAGEVDSADEQLVSCTRMPSSTKQPDDPSSSYPSQDSIEEVSDSKEILPETTSANLSDDKPNIDQQGDTNEASCSIQNIPSESSKLSSTTEPALNSNGDHTAPSEETTNVVTQEESAATLIAVEEKFVSENEIQQKETTPEKVNKETSSDDNENEEPEHEIEERKKARQTESSSESQDEICAKSSRSTVRTTSRSSRRKHRNKYRDSSNSDTQDSEDEVSIERKVKKDPVQEDQSNIEVSQEDNEPSASPDHNANTVLNNTQLETEQCENSNEKFNINIDKPEHSVSSGLTTGPKSMKVNLKRSFSSRIMEKNDNKYDDTEGNNNAESANQNKENCSNGEQEQKCIPRKRRWGTALSTDTAPSYSISTDSLKELVPGAKPLPINEVRLSKDDDEEKDTHSDADKWHGLNSNSGENLDRDDNIQKNGTGKKGDRKTDNHLATRRKISIVKDTPHIKSPSPPTSAPTNILLIKNLVRPFTLNQIKELLTRTGTIVENGFWMDRIKSKCFVEYTNEDQAFETRQALHGISWPVSNPKRLHVEYATKEDMELARELSKDQPIPRKTEPLVSTDIWQHDWGRDERTNATKVTVVREWDLGKEEDQQHVKEKERDKKEHDKKKRQRSRTPTMEAHLPAPARKFKKKEDEPPPAKLLDDLFRKTKATPCIYWLPLTNEQIVVKEEMRRQHMAEHARRLEEMRRAERNRDGRRRRSPRK